MRDSRRSRFSVGAGLVAAMAAVFIATAGGALLIGWFIAPGIFHDHLHQAGISEDSMEAMHVEWAFADTVRWSWGVAAGVAALLTLALGWYLARRVQRTMSAVVQSTERIADGRYDSRVDGGGIGREFDQLAVAVNRLAETLGDTEATRRRMLSDLAHEMRTPLATIDSYLEAIEDGVRQPDADTMAILHDGADRLRRLAEDVSAVSRAQEGAMSVVPESITDRALIDAAVDAVAEAYAAKGVNLRVDVASPTPLTVDPARIGQVLGNLLTNALRHTPAGGTVRVDARSDGESLLITVADDGDGIAPEHLAHVFDRFYRADTARDRDHGGSGIGLTIARALAQAHGGDLTAASDGAGTGSAFAVRLPRT
nr:HAMP domain-containing sensor histidine kinase [Gordonia phthalatica]